MKRVKEVRGLKCPNHEYVAMDTVFCMKRLILEQDLSQVHDVSSVATPCHCINHKSINSINF